MSLKYCACQEKVRPGHIPSAAPVTQNYLPKTEDRMLQSVMLLRKSAPGPPNISDEHVCCTVPATENASLQILLKCPTPANAFEPATKPSRFYSLLTRCTIPCVCHAKRHLNVQKWPRHVVLLTFWLGNVLRATTACTFSTSQLPKVVWTHQFLTLLTWKCSSRHNGVHFFDISIPESASNLTCFVHFDFDMCFAPQRRALFLLSSGQMAPAPAALASLLFDPPEPHTIGKTQWTATFLPFRAPASSFFWLFLLTLSLLWFFSSLTLPTSAFPSVHIVRSLTSNLPSTKVAPSGPWVQSLTKIWWRNGRGLL